VERFHLFIFFSGSERSLFQGSRKVASPVGRKVLLSRKSESSPLQWGQRGPFSSGAERYLLQVVGEVSSRAERFPLHWGWNDLLISGKERSWWQRDKKKSYAVERKDFLSNKGKVS
jgi:hypothetical protein